MDQNVRKTTSGKVSLHHAPTGINVTFALEAGSYARIGAAAEMEISLPLAGLEPYELRLDRDPEGHLIAQDGKNTYVVADGSEIRIGAYVFTVRVFFREVTMPPPLPPKEQDQYIPPRWVIGTAEGRPEPAVKTKRGSNLRIYAAAAVVVLLGTASVMMLPRIPHLIVQAEQPAYDPGADNEFTPGTLVTPGTAEPEKAAVKREPEPETVKPPAGRGGMPDWAKVAADVRGAVFTLRTLDARGELCNSGTAFALAEPRGYMVTAARVVAAGCAFEAETEEGEVFKIKTIRFIDSMMDLAFLEVDGRELKGLKLSAEKPEPARLVAVLHKLPGKPVTPSEGAYLYTWPAARVAADKEGDLMRIATPVPEGGAGAPVLNAGGEVTGVVTQRWPSAGPGCFAIPLEDLKAALLRPTLPDRLIEDMNQGEARVAKPPAPVPGPTTKANEVMRRDPLLQEVFAAKLENKWTEAHRLAARLTERYPDSSEAHFEAATAAQMANRNEAAARLYESCLKLEPSNAMAWYNLGLAQFHMGKNEEAESAFERAVKEDSSYRGALETLITLRISTSKWPEAGESLIALGQMDRAAADYFVANLLRTLEPDVSMEVRQVVEVYRSKFPETKNNQPGKENIFEAARVVVEAFLKNKGGGDADEETRDYAAAVSPYFLKKSGASAEIRSDIAADRRKWPVREYSLLNIEGAKRPTGTQDISIIFTYTYKLRNGAERREGTMRQEALFSETEKHTWVVKGIMTMEEKDKPE